MGYAYTKRKPGVDGHSAADQHGPSGLEPNGPVVARAYHRPGQRIGQDLVGYAENFSEGADQGFLSGCLLP